VRPLSDSEKEKGKAWKVENNKIAQADPLTASLLSDAAPYTLDNVFDGPCSTAQVYHKTTRDLIHQVVEGFNSTVFAYGQTSSGKTHTMRGTDTEPGIIPLAVREIFDLISANKDREFLLRVSYMEVRYNLLYYQPPHRCCKRDYF
jgi:centromeric protein E